MSAQIKLIWVLIWFTSWQFQFIPWLVSKISSFFKVSIQRKIYDDKGEIGLRVQKSTDSGCCQVYQDPNSGQLRSFCFGSMCGTFHSHGEEDDSDYSETDDEDEDDYENDDDEEEEEDDR